MATATLIIFTCCAIAGGTAAPLAIAHGGVTLPLYPAVLDQAPDLCSPTVAVDGKEVVVGLTKDHRYAVVEVTPVNGEPYVYGKGTGLGQQLEVDGADFPTLALTGLHSEIELATTRTITERSTARITHIGRPGMASGAGFMAADEDIISVLAGDNRLVASMGLTHPELARPLFHVVNSILVQRRLINSKQRPWGEIVAMLYNGYRVQVQWSSTKGWQESIFDDEIYGGYHINISRALEPHELRLVERFYPSLDSDQMQELIRKLSSIHMGEMGPYYVMRYGFYEGHTDYRAEPLAIALIFGLRSIEQLEASFPGSLPEVLTAHHTRRTGIAS